MARKSMHNPAHPGEVIRETVINGLNLKIVDAARKLDVDRTTLSRLLNGHIDVSVEMALRLAKALGTSPQLWLNMQQAYDLWQASKCCPVDLSNVERLDTDNSSARL